MAEIVRRAAVVSADGQFAARVGVAMAQRYPPFEDDRYRELARRIVFHEQLEALQPERRQMFEVWLQNRLQGRDGVEAGRTIGDAFKELEDTSHSDSSTQAAVSAIRAWLETYRV